jgi:hypothetical protein
MGVPGWSSTSAHRAASDTDESTTQTTVLIPTLFAMLYPCLCCNGDGGAQHSLPTRPRTKIHCENMLRKAPSKVAHSQPRLRFASATSPKTKSPELKPLALHEDAGRMGFRCRPNSNPRLGNNTPSHTWMLASARDTCTDDNEAWLLQLNSENHCEVTS